LLHANRRRLRSKTLSRGGITQHNHPSLGQPLHAAAGACLWFFNRSASAMKVMPNTIE